MSSAKTIADILAFAELIDVKSFIGNPFTSQPMYVAACAFLAEAVAHTSQPPSRAISPPSNGHRPWAKQKSDNANSDQKAASARHTLLATAANQNYQRCYKALKTLGSYWAGCRYILTALDQKSKGLMDPLLFTAEDVDGEMPSTKPSFTTPGWRRSISIAASLGVYSRLRGLEGGEGAMSFSPTMDLSHVIGWSLTGTANSPAPNLSFLYPNTGGENGVKMSSTTQSREKDGIARNQPVPSDSTMQSQNMDISTIPEHRSPTLDQLTHTCQTSMPTPRNRLSSLPYDPVSTAEADLLLGLHFPYAAGSTGQSVMGPHSTQQAQASNTFEYPPQQAPQHPSSLQHPHSFLDAHNQTLNNMLIESQDVDMSGGQQLNFNFPGGDMIPWLEYLPQDVLNYFGDFPGEEDGIMRRGQSQLE